MIFVAVHFTIKRTIKIPNRPEKEIRGINDAINLSEILIYKPPRDIAAWSKIK